MTVLIKILQVILALSLLIIIHESGHFFFAKIFGIRVEKFFLFFDVGKFKLFSTKSGWFVKLFPAAARWETEYGIGWLPLGGYCKIAGMIDESMDLESMKREPQPWEFRTHPAWQRLLVMAGGVLFNFISAIVIFCCIMGIWGSAYIPNEGARIYVNELSYDMGFRNGDHIISMDGYEPEDFSSLQAELVRREVSSVKVLRDRDTLDLYIDRSQVSSMLNSPDMFALAIPFVVDSIDALNPNSALLARGDAIYSIGGREVRFLQDARKILPQFSGAGVELGVLRGEDSLDVNASVDSLGRLGVFMQMPEVRTRNYSFTESIPAGLKLSWETVSGYLKDIKLIATPSTGAYKSVGSFIAIGQIFPSAWDSYRFMYLLALLSIMLGVMNLLPIPGLDGGHILFTLYEMVSGRKPSDRFLAVAQMIGMILLILLMLLAFGNDIGRLIR